MLLPRPVRYALATLALLAALHRACAQAPGPLFTPTAENISRLQSEKDPVLSLDTSSGAPALRVEFPGGNDYPGFNFPVPGGQLDLTGFSGVEVEVTNLGPARLNLNLRADNPGDWRKSPWNTENLWIGAGETKTLRLTFGRSFGSRGYALDPAKISGIKFFAAEPKQTSVVLIRNLRPFGGAAASSAAGPATGSPATAAALPPVRPIFTPAGENIAAIKTEGDPVLSLDASASVPALKAAFPNGGDYPGFDLPLAGGQLDLSGYVGIQAEIVNVGASRLNVNLRADNPGDWRKSPWNTGNVWISPGETKTVRVVFGQSYGHAGYALDPAKVGNVKLFVANPKPDAAILVKNIAAYGPGAPASAAAKPTPAPSPAAAPVSSPAPASSAGLDSNYSPSIGGELLDLAKPDALTGFTYADSTATLEGGKLKVVFAAGSGYPNIRFPLPRGGWNLSAFDRVEVDVTNPGPKPVTPHLRVDNPGNWKDEPWNTQRMSIPPGETRTIRLVFGQDNGAPGFALNPARVIGIQLFLERPLRDTALLVSNLRAAGSPADAADRLSFTKPEDRNIPVVPPIWLGQRPPVEGDWVRTLDENFDGYALNTNRWTTRFPWDGPQPGQLQRYSPDNVSVEDGFLVLTAEKKFGHENDDPALGTRAYTSGIVTSYDKWSQRYGYFEARVKLPYVRGLWPAFWMMPDRGREAGDVWQRRDTARGGMEIDIMEVLSEWGPGRNNVAVHWDGYGADHKQWGTAQIYFGSTPDGWHAFGVLWEPGKLTWFVDGRKTAEWANERVGSTPAYLKLNIQIGGWATKDVDDANLPATMQVDYVRAWQLKGRR